jgi:hypothetical protein
LVRVCVWAGGLLTGARLLGSAGEKAFTSTGCAACCALELDKRIVGPTVAEIGAHAAERLCAAGFTPELMPQTFSDMLTPRSQADLIALC